MSKDVDQICQQYQPVLAQFGHRTFRPGQASAIATLLEKGRLLYVAPTGGGKSLVYQMPAVFLPGTTLVISPLVALMADQVQALVQRGIRATYLAATLSSQQLDQRQAQMIKGYYQLVYVAPERLVSDRFLHLITQLTCPLIAIDEAHCISEWGHDFRPEYGLIGNFLARFPSARTLACTATATPFVRDDIVRQLSLPEDTPQLVQGFARPNLALTVTHVNGRSDKSKYVNTMLEQALATPRQPHGAAIVYSPTRAMAEQEAQRLSRQGWRVGCYHAGLPAEHRSQMSEQFADRALDIMVATNAFGLGIDRDNVRAVIHLGPPGSIEAYYQEVGRAGRDGVKAWGLLLIDGSDIAKRRWLINHSVSKGAVPSAAWIEHKWNLFLELLRWAEGGSCRHDAILRYFADDSEIVGGCGHCDVCLQLGQQDEQAAEPTIDLVRKGLSGVARVSGLFGLTVAVKLLRGQEDPRLSRRQLQQVSTFGVLRHYSEDWVTTLLRRFLVVGWIDLVWKDVLGHQRPFVQLTELGRCVMQTGQGAHRFLLPVESSLSVNKRKSQQQGRLSSAVIDDRSSPRTKAMGSNQLLEQSDHLVFEALRSWRIKLARSRGVPAFMIASDRTLREIAIRRPAHQKELCSIYGISDQKALALGADILAVVQAHE